LLPTIQVVTKKQQKLNIFSKSLLFSQHIYKGSLLKLFFTFTASYFISREGKLLKHLNCRSALPPLPPIDTPSRTAVFFELYENRNPLIIKG